MRLHCIEYTACRNLRLIIISGLFTLLFLVLYLLALILKRQAFLDLLTFNDISLLKVLCLMQAAMSRLASVINLTASIITQHTKHCQAFFCLAGKNFYKMLCVRITLV